MAPKPAGLEVKGPAVSVAQELEKLAKLRSEGAITEDEYQAAKARVLATTTQPVSKAA